jgi:hypothetical protein
MIALAEWADPGRIPVYIAVSAMALVLVIACAGSLGRGPGPSWLGAAVAAIAISVAGILFAKFGAQRGLPVLVYYLVPIGAAMLIPPIAFRFGFWRTLAHAALVLVAALLLHAAFFYGLGWDDYMPILRLPR